MKYIKLFEYFLPSKKSEFSPEKLIAQQILNDLKKSNFSDFNFKEIKQRYDSEEIFTFKTHNQIKIKSIEEKGIYIYVNDNELKLDFYNDMDLKMEIFEECERIKSHYDKNS